MGIEPTPSAWKAEVLPLNYTRTACNALAGLQRLAPHLVEGVGFEPTKAKPSDLQSDPFGRSGTPPIYEGRIVLKHQCIVNFLNQQARRSKLHKTKVVAGSLLLNTGAGDRNRTRGLLITNQLLYQLSYASQQTFCKQINLTVSRCILLI